METKKKEEQVIDFDYSLEQLYYDEKEVYLEIGTLSKQNFSE